MIHPSVKTNDITGTPVARERLIINGRPADKQTYNRVMNAKPAPLGPRANCPKAFSILK